jgi:hypothetical protein
MQACSWASKCKAQLQLSDWILYIWPSCSDLEEVYNKCCMRKLMSSNCLYAVEQARTTLLGRKHWIQRDSDSHLPFAEEAINHSAPVPAGRDVVPIKPLTLECEFETHWRAYICVA